MELREAQTQSLRDDQKRQSLVTLHDQALASETPVVDAFGDQHLPAISDQARKSRSIIFAWSLLSVLLAAFGRLQAITITSSRTDKQTSPTVPDGVWGLNFHSSEATVRSKFNLSDCTVHRDYKSCGYESSTAGIHYDGTITFVRGRMFSASVSFDADKWDQAKKPWLRPRGNKGTVDSDMKIDARNDALAAAHKLTNEFKSFREHLDETGTSRGVG